MIVHENARKETVYSHKEMQTPFVLQKTELLGTQEALIQLLSFRELAPGFLWGVVIFGIIEHGRA